MKILSKNNLPKTNFLTKKTILITAGETGGHIFPAECLAWEFNKIGWDIVFISDKRGSKFVKNLPNETPKVPSGTIIMKNENLELTFHLSNPSKAQINNGEYI